MSPFSTREEKRQQQLQNSLRFTNLHSSVELNAIEYFAARNIKWHSQNELHSSQISCLNFWFPMIHRPELLAEVLRKLGYSVAEVLPFKLDFLSELSDAGWNVVNGSLFSQGSVPPHFIAFEWIGWRNYLGELQGTHVAGNFTRTRGQHFSSVDFAIRFRRNDGKIQIIMCEWKYTESYSAGVLTRYSNSGTDRLGRIYRPHLENATCQIELGQIAADALLYNPFDQMMRHQLLCSAMEQAGEMDASIVSYLHIAPKANRELMETITSPGLQGLGQDIYKVWTSLVPQERFKGVHTEEILDILSGVAGNEDWVIYLLDRYGGMV